MITSGKVNTIKNFQPSGVKEIGSYTYLLLIDSQGQCLIQRIKSDNTEIKFVKLSSGTIDNFWSNPASEDKTYVWHNNL